jgi:hypothetical protein
VEHARRRCCQWYTASSAYPKLQLLTQLALHMDAVQLRRKVSRLLSSDSSSSPARVVVQGGVVAGDADEFDSYTDAGMDIEPAGEPRGSSLLASVFGRAKPSDSGTFASLPSGEKVSTVAIHALGKLCLFLSSGMAHSGFEV